MLTAIVLSGFAFAQDKGRLGVEVKDLTKEEAEKLGLPEGHGVRVVRSVESGPAAVAGLMADDIILSIDGADVTDMKDLIAIIQARSPGEQVLLRVSRNGTE
jgi:S1-C subfamily serine protease